MWKTLKSRVRLCATYIDSEYTSAEEYQPSTSTIIVSIFNQVSLHSVSRHNYPPAWPPSRSAYSVSRRISRITPATTMATTRSPSIAALFLRPHKCEIKPFIPFVGGPRDGTRGTKHEHPWTGPTGKPTIAFLAGNG